MGSGFRVRVGEAVETVPKLVIEMMESDTAAPCVPAAGYSSLVVMGDEPTSLLGLQYGRNNATLIFFEARGVAFTTVAP